MNSARFEWYSTCRPKVVKWKNGFRVLRKSANDAIDAVSSYHDQQFRFKRTSVLSASSRFSKKFFTGTRNPAGGTCTTTPLSAAAAASTVVTQPASRMTTPQIP